MKKEREREHINIIHLCARIWVAWSFLFAPSISTYLIYCPFLLYVSKWLDTLCDMCILIRSLGLSVCFSLGQASQKCTFAGGNFPTSKGFLSPQSRSSVLPWPSLKTLITAFSSPSYKTVFMFWFPLDCDTLMSETKFSYSKHSK